mgnify:CR=1 FL=1
MKLGWITALAVALALVSTACATALRGTCYFGKVCVEWNDQPDQDVKKLDKLLMEAEWAIGVPITPMAEIIFVPRLPGFAQPHTRWGGPVVAWFAEDSMLIYVIYIADLARAAIGHELFHRELMIATDASDVDHLDPRWSRFCGTRDNPC